MAIAQPAPEDGPAPKSPQENRPCAVPPALTAEATSTAAALGTVAPPLGQLLAVVRHVHYDVLHGLTAYTWNDAPAEERREAPPPQAAHPRSDCP